MTIQSILNWIKSVVITTKVIPPAVTEEPVRRTERDALIIIEDGMEDQIELEAGAIIFEHDPLETLNIETKVK